MKEKQRNLSWTTSVAESTNIVIKKHRKVKSWQRVTGVLAVVVLLCSTYTMILPALTMEQQTYCGQEEHVHTDACYEQRLICGQEEQHTHKEECYADVETCVCGQEETEGHTHSEQCYADDGTCVCGMEETAGHTHDESCYVVQKELVCTTPEDSSLHKHTDNCYEKVLVCGKEEHTHNLMCYSNPEADVESQAVWDRSVGDVNLTGIWADDLIAIAESQLGYKESVNNYIVDENGDIKGYSRYGAWYGDAYGDWCAMFVAFCLNYAEIPSEDMPDEASSVRWIEKLSELDMYEEADSYAPQRGDLIFLSSNENEIGADRVGIISGIITDTEETPVKIHVIEGDSENSVAEKTYELNDSHIFGYGKLPENTENTQQAVMTETPNMQQAVVTETPNMQQAVVTEIPNIQQAVVTETPEIPSLADSNLSAMTTEELNALLEQISPEDLQVYLESLSDEEYDELMDNLSEEANEKLTMFLTSGASLLATSDTYIGFSKATSDGDIDFALGGGGAGVRKYYLVPYSVYSQFEEYGSSNSSIYDVQDELIGQSELAYCYNFYEGTPYSRYENKVNGYAVAQYNKSESSSASLFYNSTAGHSRYSNQQKLYKKVLTMAMNGYPNDYSGIGSKYNLTADEFRFITQYAIWYCTDSISLNYKTIDTYQGKMPAFYVYADDTKTWLTKKSDGTNGYYSVSNSNVAAAYNELINSTLDTSTVDTAKINLYQNTGSYFQNLLTVGLEEAPPAQQEPNRLKLTKTVSGTAADKEQEFTFTIQLLDSNYSFVNGSYTVIPEAISGVEKLAITSITFSGGQATVKLKHGQSITIDDLPDNFYYTVVEEKANQEGYTTTITEGQNSNMQSGDGALGTVPVTFNNHKDVSSNGQLKAQITARKTIDGGQTDIGNNKFKFRLTGNGQDVTVENDENGDILFPEISYSEPGTYTYTIEEVTDERDGVSFDFDKSKKNVTVTITSQAVQTYDSNTKYYAFEKLDYYSYYYVDTEPGGEGIIMYCTNQDQIGPQYATSVSVQNQTYSAIINPDLDEIKAKHLVNDYAYLKGNNKGKDLIVNLKKLFYYFETGDKIFNNNEKQALVWTVTDGKYREMDKYYNINNMGKSKVASKILENIYSTVTVPTFYNLAFFVPTGTQADKYPQPLATGYGALINKTVDEVVFNNPSKEQNPPSSTTYEAVIKATKTLDGEVPADGQFTFILRNSAGEEIGRQKNDANGEVVFLLTFDDTGTYTYTIEELNDHQSGIVYDSEVKTVIVEVGNESIQEIVDGDSFVGSHVSEDYYITVNGTTQLDVYCIDGSAGYPEGTYNKVFNPTSGQLAKEVTKNNHGDNLAENMRKLLYYFDTHSYTDKVGYTTLTKTIRQELIWCLTGNPDQQNWSYTSPLNQILAESDPPSDYVIVMFASTGDAQPVIAGYLPATEVIYSDEAGVAEFENYHAYVLPETGGGGTKGYAIGGLLLMSGALLLMYKMKLARKEEVKC